MIQRIQSIFLALAAVCAGISIFLPIGTLNGETMQLPVYLMGLCALMAVIAIGALFLYKNRPLQMKVTNIGVILTLVVTGILLYLARFSYDGALDINYLALLPSVCFLLFRLAFRFIKKDEELVRGADRFR